MTIEDYPIGCEVEMLWDQYSEVPKGTIGKVIAHACGVGVGVVIDWGYEVKLNKNYWSIKEEFFPNRLRVVNRTQIKSVEQTSDFCFCNSRSVVWSSADGKPFLYCRGCKKERQSEVRV